MTLNKVMLHGNLGKDPELKMTTGGVAFCRFSLATTETWLDNNKQKQQKTEWHSIISWGKVAERANQHLRKGKEILLEGKIEYQTVPDKDNPQKKITFTNIKMLNFDFCGKRDSVDQPVPEPGYIPNSSEGDDLDTGSVNSANEDSIPF